MGVNCGTISRSVNQKGGFTMKITIGSDHGAVELKEEVKKVLAEFPEAEVSDVGTFGMNVISELLRCRHLLHLISYN